MKKALPLVILFFLSAFSVSVVGQDANSCNELLRNGVYDQYRVSTDTAQFKLIHSIVCSEDTSTYSKASSKKLSTSMSVVDFFDGAFSGSTNSSNYSSRRQSFCSSDYSSAASNDRLRSSVTQANVALAQAFVSCVAQVQGTYAYVEPSSNLASFTIHVLKRGVGSNRLDIVEFATSLPVKSCTGGLADASVKAPVVVSGSASFLCTRENVADPISLAGNTASDGPLFMRAIELPGTAATIESLAARVNAVEAASIPYGTVAYFNLDSCPRGWRDIPSSWQGRYIVATLSNERSGETIGKSLGHLENRATGRHIHMAPVAFRGGDCRGKACAAWGGNKDIDRYEKETGKPLALPEDVNVTTDVPGTNAPYVTLRACERF